MSDWNLQNARSPPIATGTRVGTDDGGDNMQMQLLRHERTQLPGANGRAAPVSSGYLTSITLTRDDSRIPARHNKVRSNKNRSIGSIHIG